ncbi:MAG: TonB-dependent receptor [Bacteroidales bacterium]|nr:TonB-dependent receptor [Bacteroidales bacterium]
MNEPYRYRVLYGSGILKILLACLTLLIVQSQVSPVMASGDPFFQQRNIRGVVTDETGAPFPFVNVYVEGNILIGTITNAKGEFRLSVPPNSVIIFAFVGYKEQKVPLGPTDVIDVKMELETKALDEVVVIGYTEQRKANVSAAVTTVKSADIVSTPVANVSQALAGRLPGLTSMQSSGEPGSDQATFYVRGVGTWNDALPLYVIDGIERNVTIFRSMSPEEIESVSILKDAAATAQYGSKGANGVILVTTKRGDGNPPSFTVRTGYSIQQFTRFPQYLDSYNSLVLMNEAEINNGGEPIYSEAVLEKYRTGEDPLRYPNTDWYELMMKPYAPMYNANFTIRGGTRTIGFFMSGYYNHQEGHIRADANEVFKSRYSNDNYRFTSNVDAYITKAFVLSFELGGTWRLKEDPYADDVFDNMNRIGSYRMPARYPDGKWAGTSEFAEFNPYYRMNTRGVDRWQGVYITSQVKMTLDLGSFIKGLSVNARISYDSDYQTAQFWTMTDNTYELISRPGRGDRYREYLTRAFFSSSYTLYTPNKLMNGQAGLTYRPTLGGDHSLGFNLISTVSQRHYGYEVPYNSASFIGIVNYNYKGKYIADFNAAYRGNENFAPGKRFGFFPAVGLAWNIHSEDFLRPVTFISLLKARLSYGKSGSEYASTRFLFKPGKWSTSTSGGAYFGTGLGSGIGTSTEPTIANPDATWESNVSVNFGMDFGVWRDKISGSFDVFRDNRSGILQTSNSFSSTLGIGVPALNIGKTMRYGWEFELAFQQRITNDLTLTIRPNIGYWQNKIIFADDPENMDWWLKEEGQRISQPTGYIVLGYFRDWEDIANSPVQQVGSSPIPGDFKYLDYNGDGIVNQFDIVPTAHTAVPNTSFGTTFDFTFKDLRASFHFQGATHSSVMVSQYLFWEFYNRAPVMEHHLGRWTPEDPDAATYPALHNGSTSQNHVDNDFWRNDNSYLRLKTVNLSYSVPRELYTRLGLKGMTMSLSGSNLLTWSRFKMLDPEVGTGTATRYYPQSKTYSFEVRVNF